MSDLSCAWGCGRQLRIRRGGSSARFCSPRCRSSFWSACRRWGEQAIAAGIISIDDLRSGTLEACTLRGESSAHIAHADEQTPTKHASPPASLPSFNDLAIETADRVFLANIPGQRTVALVLCAPGGYATMAELEPARAMRLGRSLLAAVERA